jgi:hypothetical protein
MRKFVVAIALVGVTLIGASAHAASAVTGSWKVVVTAIQGVFPGTITFAETAEGFKVTIDDGGAFASAPISAVSVRDKEFSFTRMMDFGDGPKPFAYSGKVDGDTLSGKVESSVGPMTITGTRIEAVAASGQ